MKFLVVTPLSIYQDASFGVKYPNVLVSMKIRNYEEMFVKPPIHIRYVELTIVICISMLAIELFYRTQPSSFHGFFFGYFTQNLASFLPIGNSR